LLGWFGQIGSRRYVAWNGVPRLVASIQVTATLAKVTVTLAAR
jgi:hypothetical protein